MMTAEQYLSQAYRLDQRIQLEQSELDNLKTLAASVGSPGFDEHNNPNHPTDAPFVKTLERIWEMEQKISTELSQLILLKQEILKVLSKVNDVDERLVLTYRYLKNMSWSEISIELGVSDRTIRRWHERALTHVVVPESAEEMGE
ncbi:sigma factor-like helix-turn-helix DNA-binding protein [Bilifractor sp. LCP19S3_H10]|jgi:RNA polymerase sigma factor (sigma-70 family)|uniref:sigma factor-like helix-turn-helix DNA-binding protein n=1 Tax=Bilifractor sp. LCP19S3_H10 TaxID=3438736 RepID=UPI003F8E8010